MDEQSPALLMVKNYKALLSLIATQQSELLLEIGDSVGTPKDALNSVIEMTD